MTDQTTKTTKTSEGRYDVTVNDERIGWVIRRNRNAWQAYRKIAGTLLGQPFGVIEYTRRDAVDRLARAA